MSARALALLVMLALAAPAPATQTSDSRKNCKLTWPGNGAMQQYCHSTNMAARKQLNKMRYRHGRIVSRCERANPGALAGTDHYAALRCVRAALTAQRRRR